MGCCNSQLTDEDFGYYVQQNPNLERIVLRQGNSTLCTNKALTYVAASPCAATTLKKIFLPGSPPNVMLGLRENNNVQAKKREANFTDAGLVVLMAKCKVLERLDISGDTAFTDYSLIGISESPSVTTQKTLRNIDLSFNENFTDVGIEALKKAYGEFWNQVEMNTEGCPNIKKDWKKKNDTEEVPYENKNSGLVVEVQAPPKFDD